jgi:hypothetical protein
MIIFEITLELFIYKFIIALLISVKNTCSIVDKT